MGGQPPTQAPLLDMWGLQLDRSQDDIYLLLVGAHIPLGPPHAASAAPGGVVVQPAHHHFTLQVHGREAVQEVEGTEFEAGNVG